MKNYIEYKDLRLKITAARAIEIEDKLGAGIIEKMNSSTDQLRTLATVLAGAIEQGNYEERHAKALEIYDDIAENGGKDVNMEIIVAKNAGFCFGVNRAVELVEQSAASGKQVATLGPIIHNRHVVAKFEGLGVKVIAAPADAQKEMTVIIRSHGVTKRVIDELERHGVEIIDATCPFVKKIGTFTLKSRKKR